MNQINIQFQGKSESRTFSYAISGFYMVSRMQPKMGAVLGVSAIAVTPVSGVDTVS